MSECDWLHSNFCFGVTLKERSILPWWKMLGMSIGPEWMDWARWFERRKCWSFLTIEIKHLPTCTVHTVLLSTPHLKPMSTMLYWGFIRAYNITAMLKNNYVKAAGSFTTVTFPTLRGDWLKVNYENTKTLTWSRITLVRCAMWSRICDNVSVVTYL